MTWDYIIIGAGSAGCALAHELLKCGRHKRVLILEAGGWDHSPYIRFPAGQIRAVANYDWGYRSQPDPSRNGAVDSWFRGRVLGGSSSINGTLYARGADRDFDRWANTCGSDRMGEWSANAVTAIFRELESSDQIGLRRGQHGPLHVRTVRRPHPITEAFLRSACGCGYPWNDDYNGAFQEGVAYAQLSQRRGMRCSAADAFLKPLLRNENLKLCLNAEVKKIELENGRAVAVMFSRGDKQCTETAQDIILCAGAIGSPKLLMLSGVGDPLELERHQIDVALNLPGVGRNLQEHPLLKLSYRTAVPTYNLTEGLQQKLGIAAKFIVGHEGPISNLFEGIAFLRSSRAEDFPDIQLHFVPVGYLTLPDGMIELAPFASVTVLLNKSRPESRGRIRLSSRHPNDLPLIECRLLECERDVATLIAGIRTVRKIMATEPIASWIAEEIAPGSDVQSVSELKDYVRNRTGIAYHPAGTCRMGTDSAAVVGPDLRVLGTLNLWIADASVMPDLISGNINAACMMIGTKLGMELAARHH